MAYDFPASPTTGQTFSPSGGPVYTWNGYAWTASSVVNAVPMLRQVFVSGSGTYTKSTAAVSIEVELVGGGAGGNSGNQIAGAVGGNTTFGSLIANGGGVGATAAAAPGGVASGGDINISGGAGSQGGSAADNNTLASGSMGGNSFFSGSGVGVNGGPGTNAAANSGSGGGGGGRSTTTAAPSGCGGGAGGYCRKLIASPAATYSYAVGAGGNGAAASGSGYAGGNGAAGIIIVTEYLAVAAAASGSRVLIQSQTVSSAVAQVDFITGIGATYDEYELQVLGARVSADAQLYIRISQDGGSTFKAGASDYAWTWSYSLSTNTGGAQGGAGSAISLASVGSAAGCSLNVRAFFAYPTSTSLKKMFTGVATGLTSSSGYMHTTFGAAYNTDTNAINAIRFVASTGNIVAGTFNLYGIVK